MTRSLIAEVGSVHDGSFGNAIKLIELAASCGADTVKFQTHIASAETLRDSPSPSYFLDEPRYAYFERTAFTYEQWEKIIDHCSKVSIRFLSSPFSLEAVDLLLELGCTTFKIPSGEVTNTPLLEKIARTGYPTILSTGMSNWQEIDNAVAVLHPNVELTIMQCTSAYPCPLERVGLNVLQEIKDRYGDSINLGFSDHTPGIAAGISAASLGANVIEKHLTFSKKMYGSDASNALEPEQFKLYSSTVREAWSICDNPINKDDLGEFQEMKAIFEKSVVYSCNLEPGTVISMEHLAFKKPGTGIPASQYATILGQTLKQFVTIDKQVSDFDFV